MSQFGNTDITGNLSLKNGNSKDISNVFRDLNFIENDLFKGVIDKNNIITNINCNDILIPGHYYFINNGSGTASNSPTQNSFLLEVLYAPGYENSSYIKQIIYETLTDIQYSRVYFEGTWSSWCETIVKGENTSVGKVLYSGTVKKGNSVNLGSDEWKKYHLFTMHIPSTSSVLIGMRYDASSEVCIRFVSGFDDGTSGLLFKANTTINPKTNVFKNISSSEHLYMHSTTTNNPHGKVIDLECLRGII